MVKSNQNLFREALLDLAVNNDRAALAKLLRKKYEQRYPLHRLALFAERRLKVNYDQAISAIHLLCPIYFH